MLFEKTVNSTLTNCLHHYHHSSPGPLVLVGDVCTVRGTPIYAHFLNKAIRDQNFGFIYTLSLETPVDFHETLIDTSLLNGSTQICPIPLPTTEIQLPLPSELHSFLPSTIPTPSYSKIDYTPASILLQVQKIISTTNTAHKPSLLFIDSLSILTSRLNYQEIAMFLSALQNIPTLGGIIFQFHCDHVEPGPLTLSNRPTNPVDIVDYLSTIVTTFIQALPIPRVLPPPPSSQTVSMTSLLSQTSSGKVDPALLRQASQSSSAASASASGGGKPSGPTSTTSASLDNHEHCLLSARIYHRHSNAKVSSQLLSLWSSQQPFILRSSWYELLPEDKTTSDEADDILKSFHGLSFNLSLTDQQKEARSNAELPYAHMGQQLGKHPQKPSTNDLINPQQFKFNSQQQQPSASHTTVLGGGLLAGENALQLGGIGGLAPTTSRYGRDDEEEVPDDDEEI